MPNTWFFLPIFSLEDFIAFFKTEWKLILKSGDRAKEEEEKRKNKKRVGSFGID